MDTEQDTGSQPEVNNLSIQTESSARVVLDF
jgi:hypothetical protein